MMVGDMEAVVGARADRTESTQWIKYRLIWLLIILKANTDVYLQALTRVRLLLLLLLFCCCHWWCFLGKTVERYDRHCQMTK